MPYVSCPRCALPTYRSRIGRETCPECGALLLMPSRSPRRTPSTDATEPGAEQMRQVLALARGELDMDIAFVSEVSDGQEAVRAHDGDAEPFGIFDGLGTLLEDTYCQRLLDGVIGNVVHDARRDERVRHLPATRVIGAYIGVPLRVSAQIYMLCCLAREARPGLGESDVRFLLGLRETIAGGLAATPPGVRFSPVIRPRPPDPPPDPAPDPAVLLETVLRHSPVGVALLDRQLRYLHVNDRWAEARGIGAGRGSSDVDGGVPPAFPPATLDRLQSVLQTGQPVLDWTVEEWAAAGREDLSAPGPWAVSFYPVRDDAQQVVGVCAIAAAAD